MVWVMIFMLLGPPVCFSLLVSNAHFFERAADAQVDCSGAVREPRLLRFLGEQGRSFRFRPEADYRKGERLFHGSAFLQNSLAVGLKLYFAFMW